MSHDLNPAQHEAVHTSSGPMLVLAGAGTGKTRVVTYRIAELIHQKVAPERILAVTFTNKAALEMRARAGDLLGRRRKKKPEISTFHSLCVRLLRRHIRRLGYPEQFAIYDRGDQESLARSALREMKIPSATLRPGDLLYHIGSWKSKSVRPDQARLEAETDREHLAASGYARYQSALRAAGAVDFDDLLLVTEELLSKFPAVRRAEADRFDHLLIDEYQDTNGSQYRIVKALASGHRNLCVVGDDDQSIYGWRGAEVEHILRFKIDWPDAKVIRLEENYRSRPEILEVANRLINFNSNRHDKRLIAVRPSGPKPRILQLQDETEEARAVIRDIQDVQKHSATPLRDIAILVRTNEQPRAFEMELRRVNMPYVLLGGMSFYDRKEVRDVMAYLKVVARPTDEVALLRIVNFPPRGISQKTVSLLTNLAVKTGKTVWECLPHADRAPIPKQGLAAIRAFRQLIEQTQREGAEGASLVTMLTSLLHDIGYRAELVRLYPDEADQESRWAAVEQVVNAMGTYEQSADEPTLEGFLDSVALDDRNDGDKESQLERNAVAIMTLHAAKGLEFPHVYLVGLEEGLLPHRRSIDGDGSAIDEERRLCYVGLTRAQDRLTITMSLCRQKWGKARDTIPSRFLYELTGQADHPNAEAARKGQTSSRPKAKRRARRSS